CNSILSLYLSAFHFFVVTLQHQHEIRAVSLKPLNYRLEAHLKLNCLNLPAISIHLILPDYLFSNYLWD
ncbi:hypothetical protein DWX62_03700, partial [Bacteroides sp. AF20-13LB]